MAKLLEVAQLVDHDGMPQVQVRGGGIEAELYAQLSAGRQLAQQLFLYDQLFATPTNGLNGLRER